jgi:hypothetical protein
MNYVNQYFQGMKLSKFWKLLEIWKSSKCDVWDMPLYIEYKSSK